MDKIDLKCTECGSENVEHKDSLTRNSKFGKKINKKRRICLDCGHKSTQPYRRKISLRWLQYFSIKLRYKGLGYKEIEVKVEQFIKEAQLSEILGRNKYTLESIRGWVLQEKTEFLQVGKVERESMIWEDYRRTLEERANSGDLSPLKFEEFILTYYDQTGLLLSKIALEYGSSFKDLQQDTINIDSEWHSQIYSTLLRVAGDILDLT